MDIEKNLGLTLAGMGATLDDATNAQIFCALLRMVRDLETDMRRRETASSTTSPPSSWWGGSCERTS